MKTKIVFKAKSALVGLALLLSSAISDSAAVLQVPTADYPTIQAAVDLAVSGDEVQIAPGVYTNQVVIESKNVTLVGSPGTVLRAVPGMQKPFQANLGRAVPLVGIFDSTNVVVSGLTLEGERLADSQSGNFVGIWFFAAGGRVEDCRVMGFRGESIDTTNGGWGIRADNPQILGAGTVNLDILRSIFADNAISIELNGDEPRVTWEWDPKLLCTKFMVNDNLIAGNGPDDTGAQFGIWITTGAGGEVKRNTISNYSYTGTNSVFNGSSLAFGIVANDALDFGVTNLEALQPVYFEGNILRSNQIDLAVLRGDGSTIVNNSFEGTAPGLRRGGLGFSGDHVLVASNRFSDMDTGIGLLGNEPESGGTYRGIASNATLIANGFCNVATNYVFEPLTTYDLQSTLGCTNPTLSVTKSALLTWPYSYDGYSVQTAPAPTGPWTNSDATVFLQDGQNSVAIPTDSNQQYFKLVKQP